MISIVIPAHNEERVIGSTLSGLIPGIESGEFEIIVVCNACTDRTVGVVRAISEKILCIEEEFPSKNNALNVGDAAAHYFPRLYLDADICITTLEVVSMGRYMAEKNILASSPVVQMKMAYSSWVVRSYYEVWTQLPYCQEGMIGTGAFMLSEQGRSRFDKFPDILADDEYVRLHFLDHEKMAIQGVFSCVRAPTNIKGLMKIMTRARLGTYEIHRKFPELVENDKKPYDSVIIDWIKSVRLWPKIIVYVYINILTRFRAKHQMKKQAYEGWERDESSRNVQL